MPSIYIYIYIYIKSLLLYVKYVILYVKYLIIVFWANPSLSCGLLFLKHLGLFSNFAFSGVFGEALLSKGVYRPWDYFILLGKTLLCMINYLSSHGFGGLSNF